jgi:hypothetical protein
VSIVIPAYVTPGPSFPTPSPFPHPLPRPFPLPPSPFPLPPPFIPPHPSSFILSLCSSTYDYTNCSNDGSPKFKETYTQVKHILGLSQTSAADFEALGKSLCDADGLGSTTRAEHLRVGASCADNINKADYDSEGSEGSEDKQSRG